MSHGRGRSLGTIFDGQGRTSFCVWAPDRARVEVALEQDRKLLYVPLDRDRDGYFQGEARAKPGQRYRYRLDGGEVFPDPCSRFQPEGPHGPSEIVDPHAFRWSDRGWRGPDPRHQVIYEVHVGTYTREGTYRALARELEAIRSLGVTCLELMPLNTFPGRFNWGYDGVEPYAPCAIYGSPDELRALVDHAHRLALSVILDVVYNHLGPDGNYLWQYARSYFSDRYPKEWGDPLDFEGPRSAAVREYVLQNVEHWIAEYHFDGFRVDATQSLYDASAVHISRELAARARAATERRLFIVGESESGDVRYVTPTRDGGHGFDAVVADDFHHACRVAATGKAEAYLQDFRGTAQELLSCVLRNSLYQGQYYTWQKQRRGTPLYRASCEQVVFALQNHDQIANDLAGRRLHHVADRATVRALTTMLLLAPQTPHLFQGQEFFASAPFLYFTDHGPELQEQVRRGREGFLFQFPSIREAVEREGVHPPSGEEAFRRSKLNLAERESERATLELHRELLRLRRDDPPLLEGGRNLEGATLAPHALVLRWFGGRETGDRLLLLNLGADLVSDVCPEPLLAAPPGESWHPVFCSESTRWGGAGAVSPTGDGPWTVPGRCALLLSSREVRR